MSDPTASPTQPSIPVPEPPAPEPPLPAPSGRHAALSGVVAAAAALATGELVAALLPGAPSPVSAVGAAVIDLAPPGTKEVVVGLLGQWDKPVLQVLVAAVVLGAGALIGLAARRSDVPASVGIGALGIVGALAGLRQADAQSTLVVLSAILQGGVGMQTLLILRAWATPRGEPSASGASATDGVRRRFLARAGVVALASVGGFSIGRAILGARADGAAAVVSGGDGTTPGATGAPGTAHVIPQAVDPAASPSPDDAFALDGISPLVTPNEDFYQIDTALVTPAVNLDTWQLRIHGMVEREVTLTFDELVAMPLVERYVTIACVSNEVGGRLIGNARWTGVRLTDVLELAGVRDGATQIVPRSVDGWTAGFPTAWVTAPERERDALIAVAMNGEPLPARHGFPARLIVPGLYGYVSATKWLSDIELTTLEAFDAYWVPRGWAKEAPILTQSRIDTPREGASVPAGTVAIGGVAWAPDRGISRVEVALDDGPWQDAILAGAIGPQTWVQWKLAADLAVGRHTIRVRATDGTGTVQEDRFTPPDPDGARGHHAIAVNVI